MNKCNQIRKRKAINILFFTHRYFKLYPITSFIYIWWLTYKILFFSSFLLEFILLCLIPSLPGGRKRKVPRCHFRSKCSGEGVDCGERVDCWEGVDFGERVDCGEGGIAVIFACIPLLNSIFASIHAKIPFFTGMKRVFSHD